MSQLALRPRVSTASIVQPQLKAIVFDWDGTCKPTDIPWWRSWASVARAHGHNLDRHEWEALQAHNGDPAVLLRKYGIRLSRSERAAIQEQAMYEVRQLRWLPGVREILDEAERVGLPRGLCSNANADWWEQTSTPEERALFTHVELAGGDPEGKPSPNGYNRLLRKLGVQPHEALVVENSLRGARAAQRAHVPVVLVPSEPFTHLRLAGAAHRDTLEGFTLADAQSVITQHALALAR